MRRDICAPGADGAPLAGGGVVLRQLFLNAARGGADGNLLTGKSRGLKQIDKIPGAAHIEQPVQGVVLTQLLKGQVVALDAVAGAVQQGEIVQLIIPR